MTHIPIIGELAEKPLNASLASTESYSMHQEDCRKAENE
jgi:hypothetical protein